MNYDQYSKTPDLTPTQLKLGLLLPLVIWDPMFVCFFNQITSAWAFCWVFFPLQLLDITNRNQNNSRTMGFLTERSSVQNMLLAMWYGWRLRWGCGRSRVHHRRPVMSLCRDSSPACFPSERLALVAEFPVQTLCLDSIKSISGMMCTQSNHVL